MCMQDDCFIPESREYDSMHCRMIALKQKIENITVCMQDACFIAENREYHNAACGRSVYSKK